MSQESGTATFLLPSTSDPNKMSKISYTREFLLSLAKVDVRVKLPRESQLLISCVFQDAPGLLSPPLCVPDSRCHKSVPQKVPDTVNHLLHRSNEPYLPPRRYKALPPSSRVSNDLLNSDTSGPSECTNQEKAEHERWTKDVVRFPEEDKWYSSKNTDLKECPEVFLMSSSTENLNTLQSTSNSTMKKLDASPKLNMKQEAVRGDGLQPCILPETTENCSTQCQPVQDLITDDESVNPWQKSVNHIDTSWQFLSVLDKGMHLIVSESYSNFDVGHPEGSSHVMEYLKKSKTPSFLSQENCGNMKNHCEVVYEKGIMELQLSELNKTSICDDSSGRSAIGDLSEAYVSSPVENKKHLQGTKQATSVSMNQNSSSLGLQIHQDLELNSFSSSSDGKSNSSSELCLPDEDSLITFDGPFLMPDEEILKVGNSMCSPERNPIEADAFSPSSPRDMIEKLVESVLNDESSPPPLLDDPKVHHGAGLEGFCHSPYGQQSYTQFCSNPGRDQQAHDSFQRTNIDSAHSFASKTISQPFILSHDDRRFDYEVSQSMFQQMINPDKLQTPYLPTLRKASCSDKLNSMPSCTLGYQQEASYMWGFMRPNLDYHGDSNINQAADTKPGARNWHPHVRGFW